MVSISHQTVAVSNNIQLGKSFIREYEAGDIPADVLHFPIYCLDRSSAISIPPIGFLIALLCQFFVI